MEPYNTRRLNHCEDLPVIPQDIKERDVKEMKLLDRFAGQALNGVIVTHPGSVHETVTRVAYDIAESMMLEREKRRKRRR